MSQELEDRYIVIKKKHLDKYQLNQLYTLMDTWELPDIRAVVIEEDWPEYDPTVNLLWERINGV